MWLFRRFWTPASIIQDQPGWEGVTIILVHQCIESHIQWYRCHPQDVSMWTGAQDSKWHGETHQRQMQVLPVRHVVLHTHYRWTRRGQEPFSCFYGKYIWILTAELGYNGWDQWEEKHVWGGSMFMWLSLKLNHSNEKRVLVNVITWAQVLEDSKVSNIYH